MSNTNSLAYPDPLLHQVCYAAIMITSVILIQQDYRAPQLTPAMVLQAKALNVAGTCTFLAGFIVWNLGSYKIVNLLHHDGPFKSTGTLR